MVFSQQEQIVVSQGHGKALAQAFQQAQSLQRLPSTVYQVSRTPQAVGRGIKANFLKQALQLVIATLDISNQVCGHIFGFRFA